MRLVEPALEKGEAEDEARDDGAAAEDVAGGGEAGDIDVGVAPRGIHTDPGEAHAGKNGGAYERRAFICFHDEDEGELCGGVDNGEGHAEDGHERGHEDVVAQAKGKGKDEDDRRERNEGDADGLSGAP